MQSKQLMSIGILALGATALGGVYLMLGDNTEQAEKAEAARFALAQQQASEAAAYIDPIAEEAVEEVKHRVPQEGNSSRSQEGFGFNRGDFAARMTEFDLDGDGILSPEERDAMRKAMREGMLARFDLDGDGKVSREERMAARQDRFENSDRGQELMREFDADGDGVLNEEEQAAMDQYLQDERDARRADQLARYDLDGDGEISQEERQEQRDDQRAQRDDFMQGMTDEFDRDGDGQLSIEEQQDAFNAMRERREVDQFVSQYDSDGDGSVTALDFEAYMNDYVNQGAGADINNDGVIDGQDLNAFRDMMSRSANRP